MNKIHKVYLPLLRVSNNIPTFASSNDTKRRALSKDKTSESTAIMELIALLIRSRPKTILLLSKTASLFVSKLSEMEKERKRSRDCLTGQSSLMKPSCTLP